MKKKKAQGHHHHVSHLVLASVIGLFMVFLIWLQVSFPFAIRQPLLRFLAYSLTMTLPSLASMLLGIAIPILVQPQWSYYLMAFILYTAISYFIVNIHHNTDQEVRHLFVKKTLTAMVLFVLWSFLVLTVIYYH